MADPKYTLTQHNGYVTLHIYSSTIYCTTKTTAKSLVDQVVKLNYSEDTMKKLFNIMASKTSKSKLVKGTGTSEADLIEAAITEWKDTIRVYNSKLKEASGNIYLKNLSAYNYVKKTLESAAYTKNTTESKTLLNKTAKALIDSSSKSKPLTTSQAKEIVEKWADWCDKKYASKYDTGNGIIYCEDSKAADKAKKLLEEYKKKYGVSSSDYKYVVNYMATKSDSTKNGTILSESQVKKIFDTAVDKLAISKVTKKDEDALKKSTSDKKISVTKVNYTLKCKKNTWVRTKYDNISNIITIYRKDDDDIKATKMSSNGYYYIAKNDGWVLKSNFTITEAKDTKTSKKITYEEKIKMQEKAKKEEKEKAEQRKYLKEQENTYAEYLRSNYGYDSKGNFSISAHKSLLTNNINGIFGMPYQFATHVDMPIPDTNFGAIYAEKIVQHMPLLMICPGKATFMRKFKNTERANALKQIIGIASGQDSGSNNIQSTLKSTGRYFTFQFDYAEYYKYVNGMIRSGAAYLNLQNTKISIGNKTSTLGRLDWSTAVNESFKLATSSKETIVFYADGATTSNESFSTTTTESQLASKINSFADVGRELGFLLGTSVGKKPSWMDENDLENTLKEINDISDKYLKGNKLLTDVAKNFATVATGGKLLFPEIWSDSEFSKSYDVSLKLRSPDGDILSWFLNIYVPLCHLVCLVAPRQVKSNGGNGYMSPFLVKAYLKGFMSVDCGIITSMSIAKGKEGSWNIYGLPTEVDVDLQIKDLYQMLMISKGDDVGWFINNTTLMDYITSTCGVNINEVELERTLRHYMVLRTSKLSNIPQNVWNGIENKISNVVFNAYSDLNGVLAKIP